MVHTHFTGKKENLGNMMLPLYTVGILSSVALSICTISPLESEDRISIKRGFSLFALGLVFFTSLFNAINLLALKTQSGIKFRKNFKLAVSDILDISNKLVSSVQALLSCLAGAVVCTYSCTRSFLRTSHFASEAYAWFGTAYFLYDIWSMFRVHSSKTDQVQQNGDVTNKTTMKNSIREFCSYVISQPMIVMHHIFIGSFGFLVIVYFRGNLGDCVYGYVYLMELSTPFVSVRGILSLLGMKGSQLYLYNGILMLLTFFVCRVFMFPYVTYLYSQVIGKSYFDAIMTLPRGCKIGITILMVPQFYWFWLMLKGAGKIFCESKPNTSTRKRRFETNSHS